MISPSDCLEEIQNGEHEKYPYTYAITDLMDADELEGRIKSIAQAVASGNSAVSRIFAVSLGNAINDSMRLRAEVMSQASVTPLDNDTDIADLKREM